MSSEDAEEILHGSTWLFLIILQLEHCFSQGENGLFVEEKSCRNTRCDWTSAQEDKTS